MPEKRKFVVNIGEGMGEDGIFYCLASFYLFICPKRISNNEKNLLERILQRICNRNGLFKIPSKQKHLTVAEYLIVSEMEDPKRSFWTFKLS